ncbi:calcium and integrin-binding family member 2-like isoform X2 [Tachypleus tridentatus]
MLDNVQQLSIIMGQQESVFTEEELEDYQELTFFLKKEILHCYKRFKMLAPEAVSKNRNVRLPMATVLTLPELQVNPFCDRICKVFSSAGDGSMTFEDFLDMMSVFSDAAPRSVKTEYAFRIYDFDEDDMISVEDLREILNRLLGPGKKKLSEEDVEELIDNVMAEADLDEDHFLAFAEFEHVISKSPDFLSSFRIRL